MKTVTALIVLIAASSSFAANCRPGVAPVSRCEIQVTGSTLAECHLTGPSRYSPDYRGNYPGNFPAPYYPGSYTYPWRRVEIGQEASACDLSLEDCKYFAFKKLNKFSYTNNCGDVSVGKSVEYVFQSLNNDGTVAEEITGRMRK